MAGLGISEKAEELRGDFEERRDAIAEEHADVIEGTTVGVVGACEENNVCVWGSGVPVSSWC